MRVQAYRNLNCKAGVVQWSIYSPTLRCVIAHCDELVMEDCTFTVNEAALHRMRHVLHKRNVVAWVSGTLLHVEGLRPAGRTERGTEAYQELVAGLTEPDPMDIALLNVPSGTGIRFEPWTMDTFQLPDGTSITDAVIVVLNRLGKCLGWEGA